MIRSYKSFERCIYKSFERCIDTPKENTNHPTLSVAESDLKEKHEANKHTTVGTISAQNQVFFFMARLQNKCNTQNKTLLLIEQFETELIALLLAA